MTEMTEKIKIAVIGIGNMGTSHAENLLKGAVKDAELVAVCDVNSDRLQKFRGKVKVYTDYKRLINEGEVNAVIIATPHYDHTKIGIDCLNKGLHVLVEKPISVHKKDAERLIAAHRSKDQVFAAMFQQRTSPVYRKLKSMIDAGELGKIFRITWIITSWFRTEAYYASGGWRATWKGEGGGVLLNQCPHNIDMWWWLFGMPRCITAFCNLGKYHNIEVEDEVTAYFEYENGTTGVFIASTGEAPGSNYLEIACDRGKVIVERGAIKFLKTEQSVSEFRSTSPEPFAKLPYKEELIEIEYKKEDEGHVKIIQNFVDAIIKGDPLIAPAEEGIYSVEIANAMIFSGIKRKTVELPLDSDKYERFLKKLIRESRPKKEIKEKIVSDMSSSF